MSKRGVDVANETFVRGRYRDVSLIDATGVTKPSSGFEFLSCSGVIERAPTRLAQCLYIYLYISRYSHASILKYRNGPHADLIPDIHFNDAML
jgi:hypothetical protein